MPWDIPRMTVPEINRFLDELDHIRRKAMQAANRPRR